MGDNIKVAIKSRPLIGREIKQNLKPQWSIQNRIIFPIDENGQRIGEPYTFDHIFKETDSNEDVYNGVVKLLVYSCLQGFNATIFAYGQTSSGKTHIMMGSKQSLGIIQLAVNDIFNSIAQNTNRKFLVRCSFFELYNENINDLLESSNTHLQIREDLDGNIRVHAREVVVASAEAVFEIMAQGNKYRKIGCTKMNKRSSRSHTIFRINIESKQVDVVDGPVQMSQLNLVDLAGSERVAQTKAAGVQLKEGVNINKSLSVLSNVIRQLSENEGFINYRDSKLTRILQSALGGNSKSLIITTITVAVADETKSTLEFAQRAKVVKNKPKVNEILSHDDKLKEYKALTQDYSSRLKRAEDQIKKMEVEKSQWLMEIERIKSDASAITNFNLGSSKILATKHTKRRHTVGYSSSLDDFTEEMAGAAAPPLQQTLQTGTTETKGFLNTIYEESAGEFGFLEETLKSDNTVKVENKIPISPENTKARLKALEQSYNTLVEFTSYESQLSDTEKNVVERLTDEKFRLLRDIQDFAKLLRSEQKEKLELRYNYDQIKSENEVLQAKVETISHDAATAIDLLNERTKEYERNILCLKEEHDKQHEKIDKENRMLVLQIELYITDNKKYSSENVELQNKCQLLSEELTNANLQITKYEKFIAEYDEHIFELHEQMSTVEKNSIGLPDISDIKINLLALENHLSKVSQVHDVKAQPEDQEYPYNDVSIQTECSSSVDVCIQTDIDVLEKEIVRLRNRINLSITAISNYQHQVDDLVEARDELKMLFDKVAVESLQDSQLLEESQERYDQLEHENIQLLNDLKIVDQQLDDTIQQHLNETEKLNKELTDIRYDNKQLLLRMKELTRDLKRMKADNNAWKKHQEDMIEKQNLMEDNLKHKECEIEKLQQQLKDYQQAYAEYQSEIKSFYYEIIEKESQEALVQELQDVHNQSKVLIPEAQISVDDELGSKPNVVKHKIIIETLQNRIIELQNIRSEYEKKQIILELAMSELRKSEVSEIIQLQTEMKQIKENYDEKQVKFESMISELKHSKDTEIEQLQGQIKEFEEKLMKSESIIFETEKIKTECERLRKECSQYESQCIEYEQDRRRAASTISEIIESKGSEIAQLRAEIKQLEDNKITASELKEYTESEFQILQNQFQDIIRDYSRIENRLTDYENDIEVLGQELTTLQSKYSINQKKHSELKRKMSELRKSKDSEIEELQAEINEYVIVSLNSEQQEIKLKTEIEHLQTEMTELRDKCLSFEENDIKSKDIISELKQQSIALANQLQLKVTKNKHLDNKKDKLTEELKTEVCSLKDKIKKLTTANVTLDDKLKFKTKEFDRLRHELENLRGKLGLCELKIDTLKSDIKQSSSKKKDVGVASIKSSSTSNSSGSSPQMSPKCVARKQVTHDLIDQRRSIGECTKEDTDILQEDLEQSYKALHEKDFEINTLKREILDLKSQVGSMEDENRVLSMEVDHYMQLSAELKTLLTQKEECCSNKIREYRQELEKQAAIITHSESTVTQLMTQIANLRWDFQENQQLIRKYRDINNDLLMKLHNAEKKLEKASETPKCGDCLTFQKTINDLTAVNLEKNRLVVEHQTKVFDLLNAAEASKEEEKMLKARIASLESTCQERKIQKQSVGVQCDLENEELQTLKNKYRQAKQVVEMRRKEIIRLKERLGVSTDIEVD